MIMHDSGLVNLGAACCRVGCDGRMNALHQQKGKSVSCQKPRTYFYSKCEGAGDERQREQEQEKLNRRLLDGAAPPDLNFQGYPP